MRRNSTIAASLQYDCGSLRTIAEVREEMRFSRVLKVCEHVCVDPDVDAHGHVLDADLDADLACAVFSTLVMFCVTTLATRSFLRKQQCRIWR